MFTYSVRLLVRHTRQAYACDKRVSIFRNFATKRNDPVVPDDFYDEEVEKEKSFLDVAATLNGSGLEGLTIQKNNLSWRLIDESMQAPIRFQHDDWSDGQLHDEAEEVYDEVNDDDEHSEDDVWRKPSNSIIRNAIVSSDIADHLDKFSSNGMRQQGFLPQEFLNYNMPWRESDDSADPHLDNFVPHTSSVRYSHDTQGLKACSGKKQRRGANPKLECHIIDLDEVNHLDVVTLRRFISTDSEILSRKATGLCSKCQRKVARTIKRSRQFGLLPHIGDYLIQDSTPLRSGQPFHVDMSEEEGTGKQSKTISSA